MSTVSEAQSAYKKARIAFKIAQEDMTISDEDKNLQRNKMDTLADNTVDALSSTKSANDILEDITPPSESNKEEDVLERTNIGQKDDDKEKDAKGKQAQDDDNKDEMSKNYKAQEDDDYSKSMKKELDAMKVQMAQMIDEKKRTKIAQNYGKLFPEQMREARVKAFLSNNEPIRVLTARFDEASILLTNKTALKVAQIENDGSIFDFKDLENSNNMLNYGGKI